MDVQTGGRIYDDVNIRRANTIWSWQSTDVPVLTVAVKKHRHVLVSTLAIELWLVRLFACSTQATTWGGTILKAKPLVVHSPVLWGSAWSVGNTSRTHSKTMKRHIGLRVYIIKCTHNLALNFVRNQTNLYPRSTMAFFYPYYEVLTIIGMILLLMATPFHLNMKGTSTWPFILWSFIWCLLRTVNGIVWHDRMDNIAPIWCDICTSLWPPMQREISYHQ